MPKKELNGTEIAEFIKERQSRLVAGLEKTPVLAIVRTGDDAVTDLYLRIKQRYAHDIGAEVRVFNVASETLFDQIHALNNDDLIDGIIIQLPLANPEQTNQAIDAVLPEKDVDGLASNTAYDAPTPTAILWLLAGYNIDLNGKNIAIIGQGRLVGAPLAHMLVSSGLEVVTADEYTKDLMSIVSVADVVITATGSPGLITASMLKDGAIVVDAGTASENGQVVGDLSTDARQREDIIATPVKGGVGPLTVSALFENLIRTHIK